MNLFQSFVSKQKTRLESALETQRKWSLQSVTVDVDDQPIIPPQHNGDYDRDLADVCALLSVVLVNHGTESFVRFFY